MNKIIGFFLIFFFVAGMSSTAKSEVIEIKPEKQKRSSMVEQKQSTKTTEELIIVSDNELKIVVKRVDRCVIKIKVFPETPVEVIKNTIIAERRKCFIKSTGNRPTRKRKKDSTML